ncbi:MAG TPA: hypothetical protein VFA59_15350 [Vicinamibacterales bacterium]|nr:hypothetical protein [Vicinamibacterales bacterium]
MAAPTLGFRVGVLGVVIFAAVALIAVALGFLFLIGLSAIPPVALAVAVLIAITVVVAITLTVLFGASVVLLAILSALIFIIGALVVAPPIGVIAAMLFLALVGLTLLAFGNPVNVPIAVLLALVVLVPAGAFFVGLLGPGSILVVLAALGYFLLGLFVIWLLFTIHPLPLFVLGLGGLRAMPTVPVATLPDFIEGVVKLLGKQSQRQIPIDAMTNQFTLGVGTPHARTDDARTFMFGGAGEDDDAATQYAIDDPAQYAMGWTTFDRVDARAAPLAAEFSRSLTDPDAATIEFWKNISRYWGAFGIAPMRKVVETDVPSLKAQIGSAWDDTQMGPQIQGGRLFVLDMTIFAKMDPPNESIPRFAPATLACFSLDATPGMPTFVPFLIQVSDGVNTRVFTRVFAGQINYTGWLYALQALKASTTVWGIWLGHVYRYHIVTAAMQMTMFHKLPELHPVRRVLGLQSKYLIGFDTVLLLLWTFPPPTSCGTSIQFLQLVNEFARGRLFNDDDPERALDALGIPKNVFSTPGLRFADINLPGLAARLKAAASAVDVVVRGRLSVATIALLNHFDGSDNVPLQTALVADLNAIIAGVDLTPAITGAGVVPSKDTAATIAEIAAAGTPPPPALLLRVNRMLLQDAFVPDLWIMQWNEYPIAHYVVSIYRAAERYVTAVVGALYPSPAAFAADPEVARWMAASAIEGNIQGLPVPLTTPAELTNVLTSLIYRITAHGMARLAPVGNPGLTWIGNFPPCLQDSRIPDPANPAGTTPPRDLTIAELLAFLPRTGTMGEMIAFIFSFGFTDNFEPLIPVVSANTTGLPDLDVTPFIGMPIACTTALNAFRAEITAFIRFFLADMNRLNAPATMNFAPTASAIHQWEMNIEQ